METLEERMAVVETRWIPQGMDDNIADILVPGHSAALEDYVASSVPRHLG